MAINIRIAPEWESLREFIESLSVVFDSEGSVIYDERNQIKRFQTLNGTVIVKSYRVPHFINKLVYGNLRRSKARRAFENAQEMLRRNFDTPEPIAYIEMSDKGLFGRSFLVTGESRYLRDFREVSDLPPTDETPAIIRDFARYTARLHDAQIFHKDYTPGNIRFGPRRGEDRNGFELIDVNRMRFGPVSMDEACRNMYALCITDDQYRLIAREYAFCRGFDLEKCETLILKYRDPNA